MEIENLRQFFGWCTVINLGILVLSSIGMIALREWITAIHARLFGIEASCLAEQYFRYLANYKILVLVFNLVPYLALRIVA
ncbi:DUF6868 family protein [Coraliomargarita akajimensis]|uniref:DUF6868 domain-containing protein n=1 Tax=Coraliomargarita akajimensis (strain DSM 45221 / IAM 15411 / JCM 23193 / KCTC 12865 / 04OKA010-24) TaxID=583355 RepID=D5EJ15_CORAD|nr:hypothetical protein [Coraliomargarita akajimensis]ADE54414.1 conserved hypothetical protein [Coraliomargarita akajimensis DSM 45221]